MQLETWIGLAASICTGISMLPQLIKTYKEKQAGEISYVMLAILIAGLGLWIWYGFKKDDWIIIISNAVSVIININILVLQIIFKEKKKA